MVSKYMKLLHSFHLFTIFWLVSNVNNLFKTECTSASNNASDIIFLSDIMKEQISFWELFLH